MFSVILLMLIISFCIFSTQLKAIGTIKKSDNHIYSMEYRGDYGFDEFIAAGGAETDSDMADYIASFL